MRIAAVITGAVLWLALHPSVVVGQSLGEIARHDRERRAALPAHARVLTNEDLQRERILDSGPPPEAAAPAPPLVVPPAVPLWEVAQQPGFSLGEYARALRRSRRAGTALASGAPAAPPALPAPPAPPARPAVAERPRHPLKVAPPRELPSAPLQDVGASVRVSRGDCLWKLARVHFGSGALWTLIWQVNPELRDPNRLAIGQSLRLPGGELVAREQLRRRLAAQYRQARHAVGAHAAPVADLHGSPARRAAATSTAFIVQQLPSSPEETIHGSGHVAVHLLRYPRFRPVE